LCSEYDVLQGDEFHPSRVVSWETQGRIGRRYTTPPLIKRRPKPKPNADTDSDEDDYGYGDANATVTRKMVDKGKAKAVDLDLNEEPAPRVCDSFITQ